MSILECCNITKLYGKDVSSVTALDHISLSVDEGEFVSIIGTSGSGKSTLMHIIGGVDKPTEGSVFIDNTDIHALKEDALAVFRRKNIGLVYQFYNLMPVLDIDENIVLPSLLDGNNINVAKLDEIVAYLGLEERRTHKPSQLSGGQQQRVSIGRALYSEPKLLLCDEPTGNLDTKASGDIIRLLKESNTSRRQTILLVTHDPDVAKQASRIITISDGRIIKDERQ